MTVSTFYASSETAGSGFASPTNAYGAPNAVYATATNQNVAWHLYHGFNIAATIPSDATVNSVKLGYRYKLTETRNAYRHSITALLGSSPVSAEYSDISEPTADTTIEFTAADVTLAELRDSTFGVQSYITRTSGTRTYVFSLDSVWVTVDWSAGGPPPVTDTTKFFQFL
jgi:hypothetical protein